MPCHLVQPLNQLAKSLLYQYLASFIITKHGSFLPLSTGGMLAAVRFLANFWQNLTVAPAPTQQASYGLANEDKRVAVRRDSCCKWPDHRARPRRARGLST